MSTGYLIITKHHQTKNGDGSGQPFATCAPQIVHREVLRNKIPDLSTLQNWTVRVLQCVGFEPDGRIHSISKVDLLVVKREAIADLTKAEPGLIERFGQLISDRQAQLAQLTIESAPSRISLM